MQKVMILLGGADFCHVLHLAALSSCHLAACLDRMLRHWAWVHVMSVRLCAATSKPDFINTTVNCKISSDPMPPWVASVPRCIFASRRSAIERSSHFIRYRNAANPRPLNPRIRSASTHVSPTVINYRPNVPPQNQELYDALCGLGAARERFVNPGRLQLALRGLTAEKDATTTRVAGMFWIRCLWPRG